MWTVHKLGSPTWRCLAVQQFWTSFKLDHSWYRVLLFLGWFLRKYIYNKKKPASMAGPCNHKTHNCEADVLNLSHPHHSACQNSFNAIDDAWCQMHLICILLFILDSRTSKNHITQYVRTSQAALDPPSEHSLELTCPQSSPAPSSSRNSGPPPRQSAAEGGCSSDPRCPRRPGADWSSRSCCTATMVVVVKEEEVAVLLWSRNFRAPERPPELPLNF